MNEPSPPLRPRRLALPRWGWAGLGLILVFVYGRGAASDPMRWEEPRRALVAMEMIHRGDYLVPRLLGEPYLNKPPLQSWLIALLAGFEARGVGPLSVRLPTLLAAAGIAWLLWRLGLSARAGPDPLPALVFLTFGILPQYGRAGELDLPFTFWIVAALATFEWGRRRNARVVQWVGSQGLVGAGVLTKGIAPLFFHPPLLLLAWRRRELGWAPVAAATGLLLLVVVVGAWVVPYTLLGPGAALRDRLGAEVAQRTVDAGGGDVLRHALTYPLVLVGTAAPWSILVLGALHRPSRVLWKGLTADAWPALCLAGVAWGAAVFAFVPGVLPRYLIPILPAAAVLAAAALERLDQPTRLWWPWVVVGAVWLLVVPWVARERLSPLPAWEAAALGAITTSLGLLAVAVGRSVARGFGRVTAGLLTAGLLYGVVYGGLVEAHTAARLRPLEAAAQELAPLVRPGVPVVVADGLDRRFTCPLAHALDRLVLVRPPAGPHDLVTRREPAPPPGGRLVHQAGEFALWRVGDPSASAP